MIYALINGETDVCENTIVLNDSADYPVPDGFYLIFIGGKSVSIGWRYNRDTGDWLPPRE